MKTGEKITLKLGFDLIEAEIIEIKNIRGKELFRVDVSPNNYFTEKDIIYKKTI